jgi:hypothetical protein
MSRTDGFFVVLGRLGAFFVVEFPYSRSLGNVALFLG